jgi:hypothetical protein
MDKPTKTDDQKKAERIAFYREMEKIMIECGFKAGFADARFKKKYGRWPTEEERS